jgi:hypothetical protein
VALRFDDNQPIHFLGIPTAGGGAQTGDPEIWDRVLSELPNASIVAMEVQNVQARRAFDTIGATISTAMAGGKASNVVRLSEKR